VFDQTSGDDTTECFGQVVGIGIACLERELVGGRNTAKRRHDRDDPTAGVSSGVERVPETLLGGTDRSQHLGRSLVLPRPLELNARTAFSGTARA